MTRAGPNSGIAYWANLLRVGGVIVAISLPRAAIAGTNTQAGEALIIDSFVVAPAQPTEPKTKTSLPLVVTDITVGSTHAPTTAQSSPVATMMTAQFGEDDPARTLQRTHGRAYLLYGRPSAQSGGYRTAGPTALDCHAYPYRPSHNLKPQNEAYRQMLLPYVVREACSAGIPAGLLDALIIQESRYNALAVSNKGAIGLTQLMPGTATKIGADAYSVEGNIRGGAAYLRSMMNAFGGQAHLALAAYNAGPGAVLRYGGIPAYRETQGYVASILGLWGYLSQ